MNFTSRFWHVDAFTSQPFKGNPAAVFILTEELDEGLMRSIAVEMNLAETAFVLIGEGSAPVIRWFTPVFEADLCGHATLASAHIFLDEVRPDLSEVTFETKFVGPLKVKKANGSYSMDFPSRPGIRQNVFDIPEYVLDGLTRHARPHTAYKSRDLMLVYDDEQIVHDINPDFNALLKYEDSVIVTARSDDPGRDFISRFFCAADAIVEDPVTGSAHCTLAPYWAGQLGKAELKAYQASKRGGELLLNVSEECIRITGEAVTVIDGHITL